MARVGPQHHKKEKKYLKFAHHRRLYLLIDKQLFIQNT